MNNQNRKVETFDFYKNEKVIYWERTNFSVNSETYGEAVETVRQLMEEGLEESGTVSVDGSIIFFDTCQVVPVEQNNEAATVMFFDSNDRLVASNSHVNNRPACNGR